MLSHGAHGYSGLAHSADLQEMDDLEGYLKERLPPIGDVSPTKP